VSRFPRLTSLLFLLLAVAGTPLRPARAQKQELSALQYIEPFLYPPFPGTASEESVFDHSSPNYTSTDNRIVTFNGEAAFKICPSPAPAGYQPPQAGVCDIGSGIYWSYGLGDWIAYNGHDGIDYGMQYRPVLAAADADQVIYAGWQDPRDHTYSLGLHVRLHHPNGYTTVYGHMSAVAVQSCLTPGCLDLLHGEVIGYSGNTGNSAGPHLHFRLGTPAGKSVDPYGWIDEQADPWPYDQRNSLWVQYPSTVVYYGGRTLVYPKGEELPYPSAPPGGVTVDDSSPLFSQSPAGCLSTAATTPAQSEGGAMRYVRPSITAATCTARWDFPPELGAGRYQVYVRIPAAHATSERARYVIAHGGQTSLVTINQKVYPNPFYVSDGWVYIGKYEFLDNASEYIALSNLTDDTPATYAGLELAVDAVRFILVSAAPPTTTPSSTITHTPSLTSSRTQTSTNTPSPTPTSTLTRTYTPTSTSSPTLTSILTQTYTPTDTPSMTLTPTATLTFDLSWTFTPSPTSSPSPTIPPTSTASPTSTPASPLYPCSGFLLIPALFLLMTRLGQRVRLQNKRNLPDNGGQEGGPK
jgi:hypothetical protein